MNIGDVERGLVGYWLIYRNNESSQYFHFDADHKFSWITEREKMKSAIPATWSCYQASEDFYIRLNMDMGKVRISEGVEGGFLGRAVNILQKSWFPGDN